MRQELLTRAWQRGGCSGSGVRDTSRVSWEFWDPRSTGLDQNCSTLAPGVRGVEPTATPATRTVSVLCRWVLREACRRCCTLCWGSKARRNCMMRSTGTLCVCACDNMQQHCQLQPWHSFLDALAACLDAGSACHGPSPPGRQVCLCLPLYSFAWPSVVAAVWLLMSQPKHGCSCNHLLGLARLLLFGGTCKSWTVL